MDNNINQGNVPPVPPPPQGYYNAPPPPPANQPGQYRDPQHIQKGASTNAVVALVHGPQTVVERIVSR